jgi:ferredoxin
MKPRKIVHDRERCIGCNSCVTLAPQSWTMDKNDGKARLICSKPKRNLFVADVFDSDVEDNERAAEACPVNIIRVEK